jgi:hypothetical protein
MKNGSQQHHDFQGFELQNLCFYDKMIQHFDLCSFGALDEGILVLFHLMVAKTEEISYKNDRSQGLRNIY